MQRALDGRVNPVYLEIGVSKGQAFRRITADEKIAVDPGLQTVGTFPPPRRLEGARHPLLRNDQRRFFHQPEGLPRGAPDRRRADRRVAAYEQVVRDVESTVRYLKDDGVIFLHDCNPALELIGRRAETWEDFVAQQKGPLVIGIWSGDVWKSIVYLRSTRRDLRVAVLKCDTGVGVVRKGSPDSQLAYTPEQIEALSYSDLAADRKRLLNLRPPRYLAEFLAESTASPST